MIFIFRFCCKLQCSLLPSRLECFAESLEDNATKFMTLFVSGHHRLLYLEIRMLLEC